MRIADQVIRFDRVRTSEAYTRIQTPGSEGCGCAMCRNYIAQRSAAHPESFRVLLQHLGIDEKKESEVFYLAPTESARRLYGGWFFFCGELQVGEERATRDEISYSVIGPGRMPSPYPRDAFGEHPLALDFTFEIQWILSSSEDPDPDIPAARSKS